MRSTKLLHIYALMSLEGTLLGAELVASHLSHSLIILTDAYHTLYNIISVFLLVISFKMSSERTLKNTFGWARIEVLGMLINMTFVVALTYSLLVEGIQQIVHASHEISEPTNYYLLFVFGVCGILSNLLYFNIVSDTIMNTTDQKIHCLKTISLQEIEIKEDNIKLNIDSASSSRVRKDSKDVSDKLLSINYNSNLDKEINLNSNLSNKNSPKNIFYGMTRELSSSILLIICGIIVINTDGTVAHLSDPVLGIIAAVLFCVTFYPKMKKTGLILLQTVPENISVERLKKNVLKEFPIILNIHDVHIWGLTASNIVATCHIILPKQTTESYDQFSKLLKKFFHQQGITLATIQPEFQEPNTQLCAFDCLMKCSRISNTNCESYACCNDDTNYSIVVNDTEHCEQVVTNENL